MHALLLNQKDCLIVHTLIYIISLLPCIESNDFTFIRLVGHRAPSRGRVEVYYGQWGTVCRDRFGIKEANVVCRELGYPNAVRIIYYVYPGSGPIWLDDLVCTGTETSLYNCSHNGVGNHDCSHFSDVGVVCQGRCCLYFSYNSH